MLRKTAEIAVSWRAPAGALRRCAPGRVNLIGEHTDYNEGFVLPLALERSVCVTVRRDGALPGDRYVRAVVAALRAEGFVLPPFGVTTDATLPAGAGLGSSAALEVALLRALRDAFGLALSERQIARIAWRAETGFVGVPCGVMDQLAAALGTPEAALLVDCRTLSVRPVPLPPGVEVVVRDSGVRHAHANGAYAERRRECEQAARALGVRSLRDVEAGDPRLAALPRARHVVEENARVLAFVAALERGDAVAAGRVMSASHASQRDLFEVSVPEVDALVAELEAEGAYGARLTGGGFGGSVVALTRTEPAPARR